MWITWAYSDTSTSTAQAFLVKLVRTQAPTVQSPNPKLKLTLPCLILPTGTYIWQKKKNPQQNSIRKSCIPLMWLWQRFIPTFYKAVQKLVLHVYVWQWKAVWPDEDLRSRAKTAHWDILGLQPGKYISGFHRSQTAHPSKARGWHLQPCYKWLLPGNQGAHQVLERFHNAPNC